MAHTTGARPSSDELGCADQVSFPESRLPRQALAVKAGCRASARESVLARGHATSPGASMTSKGGAIVHVLELEVSRGVSRGEYAVKVIRSPAGEASASFTLDFGRLLGLRPNLQNALLASSVGGRRIVMSGDESLVRTIGRELFDALFESEVIARIYSASRALADGSQEELRIVLRAESPELAALPWEAMYDAASDWYLSRREPLVRHIPVATPPAPPRTGGAVRILGVISSPRGMAAIDVTKERENLASALAGPVNRGLVELKWAPDATWSALQELLLGEEWHVVHFIGHAGLNAERDEGILTLVGDDGRANRVEGSRFADLLRQAWPMPRLVVLNSSVSATSSSEDMLLATAATLVRGGVSAVAAMQFEITDNAAIAFYHGFYNAIAHGRSVDEAFGSGRVAILGSSAATLEWLTPVLYMGGMDSEPTRVRTEDAAAAQAPPIANERVIHGSEALEPHNPATAVPRVDEVLAEGPEYASARDLPAGAVREITDEVRAGEVENFAATDVEKVVPPMRAAVSVDNVKQRRERTYRDFDLLVEGAGESGRYRARVLGSPAGEAGPVAFELPFTDQDIELFLLKIGRPRVVRGGGARRNLGQAIEDFGGKLFDAVFHDEIRVALATSLERVESEDAGLRIRLRLSEVPELDDLPWEFAYDRMAGRFLALSDWTPLVRYLQLSSRIRPLAVTPPLRILVMAASPVDFDLLDSAGEKARLHEALDDLVAAGQVVLEEEPTGTLAGLQRQLRRGEYHVFHFIGHGEFDATEEDGVLYFEGRERRGQAVPGQALGELLHDHRSLRLAVLNACEGARSGREDPFAGTAQSVVRQGIPAVVAMQFEITDDAAITFARSLYEAVADGYPLDASMAEARKAVKNLPNLVEWATPVLHMRAGDGRVFAVEASP